MSYFVKEITKPGGNEKKLYLCTRDVEDGDSAIVEISPGVYQTITAKSGKMVAGIDLFKIVAQAPKNSKDGQEYDLVP